MDIYWRAWYNLSVKEWKKHRLSHWGVLSHGTAHPGIESCLCYWFNSVKPTRCLVQHLKQNYHAISDADYHYYIIITVRLLLRVFSAIWGFPGGSDSKESSCDAGEPGLIPRSRKIPWRRAWQPTPVFLSGQVHGWRSLELYSPWGCKELDMT